jgi:hypothetical protein
MPVHASQLYAMNVQALLALTVKDGSVVVDVEDEVLDGCAVVLNGEIRNEAAKAALGGATGAASQPAAGAASQPAAEAAANGGA